MYDFHKIKGNEYSNCFSHPLFQRGSEHLIKDIKRKVCTTEGDNSVPEPHKKAKSKDMLSTINELSKRLIQLEDKGRDYEDLLRNYRDISEKNQRLEQMLMYFSQAMNNGNMSNGSNGVPMPFRDGPQIRPDGAPHLSPRMYKASPSPGPSIHNLFGDPMYPLGRFPNNRVFTMGRSQMRPGDRPMIEAPGKSPVEESKDPANTQRRHLGSMDPYAAEFVTGGGISPKLPEFRMAQQMFSPGVSPVVALASSPFNPLVDTPTDREPNYLKKIELSPLRAWPPVPEKRPSQPAPGEDQIGDKSTACNEVLNKSPAPSTAGTTVKGSTKATKKE